MSAASGSAGLVLPLSLSSASPNGRCKAKISELLLSLPRCCGGKPRGARGQQFSRQQPLCLTLEAAIRSVCSRPGNGPRDVHPHATLSSSLAKPTGLYIAHRFLGGTLGYQNFEVSEDVSASLCRKRVPTLAGAVHAVCGCCSGSTDAGTGGSRSEPRTSSREKRPYEAQQ